MKLSVNKSIDVFGGVVPDDAAKEVIIGYNGNQQSVIKEHVSQNSGYSCCIMSFVKYPNSITSSNCHSDAINATKLCIIDRAAQSQTGGLIRGQSSLSCETDGFQQQN